MKKLVSDYVFDPSNKTITIPDDIELENLLLITNVTTGDILFNFADKTRIASISNSVITLTFDTTEMNSQDRLQIWVEQSTITASGDAQMVGNARSKFRDSFAEPFVNGLPESWTVDNKSNHLITQGGNAAGSSYLRISLNPTIENSDVTILSKQKARQPLRIGFGLSISQRITGQEVFAGFVEDNDHIMTPVANVDLTGATVNVTSNVATIVLASGASPYVGGDRVAIKGFADSRMNVGPVFVTPITWNSFSVPVTIANGSYSPTGASISIVDPLRWAYNGAGWLWGDNNTSTNCSIYSRRNGGHFRSISNSTTVTSNAVQSTTAPYSDAFNAGGIFEQTAQLEELLCRTVTSDIVTGVSSSAKLNQGIPDEAPDYKICIRASNLPNLTKPVGGRISSASKAGSTTVTITTTTPHGLSVNDYIMVYGILDQTNFANLTTATAVASVINATTFTVAFGVSATASSSGGAVFRIQGGAASSVYAQTVQSISQVNGITYVVGSTTWATPIPGEMVYAFGLSTGDGWYKVLRVNNTSLELQAITPVADFTLVSTGGVIIKATDVRLHFVRSIDYTRELVEVTGGKASSDQNNAVPSYITNGSVGVSQSSGSTTSPWNAAGYSGYMVADVTSGAITSSNTTSAITPGALSNIGTYSHTFNVVVTAVSGTNPTLDVGVEESVDNGTNWVRVYDFERITANGSYSSPQIRATYGTRYRYVQTIAGSSPSFTRAINRVQFSTPAQLVRRFIDRSITLTTLNSTTPTYNVDGCNIFELLLNIGAVTTTAPQVQLQGSETGSDWYLIGTPLTGVASSTVRSMITGEIPRFIRAIVTTAGVGVTAGYLCIKGISNS